MYNYRKLLLPVVVLLLQLPVMAQSSAADTGAMARHGKIYVVLAVVLTILAGLLFYVFRLDRKISKLEKGEIS